MVFNTTSAEIIDRSLEASTHAPLFKQLIYSVIGMGLGWCCYAVGYEKLIRYSVPLLMGASLLLVLVLVPGIGMKINGARRWIGVMGIPIGQPSEIIKILLPCAYIYWFLQQKEEITFRLLIKFLVCLCFPVVLIMLEPDNGTTFLLGVLLVALLWLSRIRLLYWGIPLIMCVVLGGGIAYNMPHVRSRFEVYFHPELDLKGKGHQPYQAKIAAGSGRLWGVGLGESLQKLNYLPEARSDYIAAIYAEEMGFLGITVLILFYIVLAASGFSIAFHATERGAFLLASIITTLIALQVFINLGVVSGLLPSKGMTLPFFSQGGSSLVVNFIALAILLDISRKRTCAKS